MTITEEQMERQTVWTRMRGLSSRSKYTNCYKVKRFFPEFRISMRQLQQRHGF